MCKAGSGIAVIRHRPTRCASSTLLSLVRAPHVSLSHSSVPPPVCIPVLPHISVPACIPISPPVAVTVSPHVSPPAHARPCTCLATCLHTRLHICPHAASAYPSQFSVSMRVFFPTIPTMAAHCNARQVPRTARFRRQKCSSTCSIRRGTGHIGRSAAPAVDQTTRRDPG